LLELFKEYRQHILPATRGKQKDGNRAVFVRSTEKVYNGPGVNYFRETIKREERLVYLAVVS